MTPFPPTLPGQRLLLRRFTQADITPGYLGWLNDSLTMRYSNQRFLRHDTSSSLRYLESFNDSPNLFLCICDVTAGQVIGTMTAYISPHHGTADMGILVGEPLARGQGYGLDAWSTLMIWLLDQKGLRKVTAGMLACNIPMRTVARRSDMMPDGLRRRQEIVDGLPQDILYFARFKNA